MENKKTVEKKTSEKKMILHSIGNVEDFSYYIFDKKQEVIEKLSKILSGALGAEIYLYEEYKDKKGKWKQIKINFEKIKDEHYSYGRANLFFGNKKIFLTLVCPDKDRLKFNGELFKFFNMPKPKK